MFSLEILRNKDLTNKNEGKKIISPKMFQA